MLTICWDESVKESAFYLDTNSLRTFPGSSSGCADQRQRDRKRHVEQSDVYDAVIANSYVFTFSRETKSGTDLGRILFFPSQTRIGSHCLL
jgi:hypothetical protein